MTRTNEVGETRAMATQYPQPTPSPSIRTPCACSVFWHAPGVASRRGSEDLMTAGRVTVNGQVATELGTKVDVDRDHIEVDGMPVKLNPGRRVPDALQADRLPHHHERPAGAPLRG